MAPRAIRTALKTLPAGSDAYDRAYEDAMERIEGQVKGQEELAKRVLSWITCAKRPLTTFELQHALAVEPGDAKLGEDNLTDVEDMVSVCAGLVTIDEESKIIRLVHYTTQEYFIRTQKRWFPSALSDITTICITYQLFSAFETGYSQTDDEFEERLHSNQLYDYATHNWGHHACEVVPLCQEAIEFLECESKVEASVQALMSVKSSSRQYISQKAPFSRQNYSQKAPKQITGLHLAAYFGINDAVNTLLTNGTSPDFRDSDGKTPLLWAAEYGHEIVAKLLLEAGANVNAQGDYGNALYTASFEGHETVVKLLLEAGADVNAKWDYGTALQAASSRGYEAVVKLLLEAGADVNTQGGHYRNALQAALSRGHESVVKLLLKAGADINA
jgi:hypothetical protein